MKPAFNLSIFLGCTVAAHGGVLTNKLPASLKNAEIAWSAPTNKWPEILWTYKVIPQEFSQVVISNLMRLTDFTIADRISVVDDPIFRDQSNLFFKSRDGSRYLEICPSLGYIEYCNQKAQARGREKVEGVPGQEETTKLGLKILRFLGVDVSQLATKLGTAELSLHWERESSSYVDEQTKIEVNLTNEFGVYFLRRIDGVDVRGIGLGGGVEIGFGNNAKLFNLHVCWRNLKPFELRKTLSPQQVMDWIRSGRISLPVRFGTIDQLRKLTITKATPRYQGELGEKRMNIVLPYLQLDVLSESNGETNVYWFDAPIILPDCNS